MIRVLHITRDFPPRSKGGISSAVGCMVRALREDGRVQCRVISFDGWRPIARADRRSRQSCHTEEPESAIFRLESPARLKAARAFALDFSPDVLHVHHGMLWDFARSLRSERSVPAVKSVHVLQREAGRILGTGGKTLSQKAQEGALEEADAIVVPTPRSAEILLRHTPSLAGRLHVIGFGVHDSQEARKASLDRTRKTGGPVLYVGRFSEIKGTPDLFRAIPRIATERPDTRFVVVGGIPDSPKNEARWQRKMLELLPIALRDRVRFTGWLAPEVLREQYARAAVLAAPSLLESYGLAVIEAMLFGLPVATTRNPGTESLVRDEETGLLSNPGDVEALARNVLRLLDDKEFSCRLGAAAARAVRQERLWEATIPDYVRLYAAVRIRNGAASPSTSKELKMYG